MSMVCDACGSPNRATAMFCIGCAGRLPGFVASGPSALEAMDTAGAERRSNGSAERKAAIHASVFWQRLVLLGLVLIIGFTGWYLYRALKGTDTAPPQATAAAAPTTAAATRPVSEVAPLLPIVPMAARSVPALPGPKAAEPAAEAPASPESLDSSNTALPSPGASAQGETPAETVEKFYRALSVGDGKTASAIVVPEKRGIGAFNETNIAKFYRSFKEPLSLRSIRQIDTNVVEAKYTYRASSTAACNGVAIVRTELVRRQTLIRSVRANC
jgi:hypothetical protein